MLEQRAFGREGLPSSFANAGIRHSCTLIPAGEGQMRNLFWRVSMQKKHLVFLLIPLLFLLASVSMSHSSDNATKEPIVKEGFIGADTCKGCHEAQYETYRTTVHSKKHVKGPASQDACETCHGPGAKHVEKGGGRGGDIFASKKKTDPGAKTAKCLACHEVMKDQAFWNSSRHSIEDV